MIELTEQQRQELTSAEPVVVDPQTRQEYVLVRKELYLRLRGLLDDDFQPSQAYAAIDRSFAEGWSDPKMDDYDRYEQIKR
jgi:hypothetical protein